MTSNQVKVWVDSVILQMAAESYLDFAKEGDGYNLNRLITALKLGNNRPGFPGNVETAENLDGKTRLTDQQIKYFTENWEIADHRSNDDPRFANIGIGNGTGFSATLFKNKTTGEYTLSFRSTEYADEDRGGDWQRDGLNGADGEITNRGFAFGQITAMEDYYSYLKSQNILPTGVTLNVTGYSLGGQLATVFTELHADEINHTYNFNSAGRGQFDLNHGSLSDLVNFFRAQLGGPISGTNVYNNIKYVNAVEATQQEFNTRGALLPPGSAGLTGGADSKISQLFGHATHGDTQWVANSGVHTANPTPIFIEDQPDIQGLVFNFLGEIFGGLKSDFGTTHSITLLADSLTLMDVVQTLDPNISTSQIAAILAAASNQRATGFLGRQGKAESDSLEQTLQALYRLYVGSDADLSIDDNGGGFGNLANRNKFYDAIAMLQAKTQELGGGKVDNFVPGNQFSPTNGEPLSNFVVPTGAGIIDQAKDPSGIAYRYALKELNPFAVLNNGLYTDYTQTGGHVKGNLDLFDPSNNNNLSGAITRQYIEDRAALLERKLYFNVADLKSFNPVTSGEPFDTSTLPYNDFKFYEDRTTGYKVLQGRQPNNPFLQHFIFGRDSGLSDTLIGGTQEDHLYGGTGNDFLFGNDGGDYLEGNKRNDMLIGGMGEDTLTGGDGNDTMAGDNGGTDPSGGADILIGEAGDDTLRNLRSMNNESRIAA